MLIALPCALINKLIKTEPRLILVIGLSIYKSGRTLGSHPSIILSTDCVKSKPIMKNGWAHTVYERDRKNV